MDRKTSPKPPMCRGGCGFYGSAATEGLCSLCYKKHMKRKQEAIARNAVAKSPRSISLYSEITGSCHSNNRSGNVIAESDEQGASDNSNPKQSSNQNSDGPSKSEPGEGFPSTSKTVPSVEEDHDEAREVEPRDKKNRCAECGKRVGLTGFTCRCGGLYCPIHRYSDRHNCKFDYRELGAEEIRRNNPTVTAEKIRKI